ncbi:ABC transporter ATP-binding protein [Paenibacillus terreus]|uniref:ABC transporter ATP-binding protein n=1 Tax=Paenibacillus terreus TaxID=1387834 RepID=A0ABV5BEX0_9BACL
MEAVIRTQGLTKRYGSHTPVDHVNLTVRQGEIYGFLGRNGAGKTTTIQMLTGLVKPTSGQIEIFGDSLFANPKKVLRRIGSMIEVPGFYENLTAAENLQINARIMGIHKKNAIAEALEITGLQHETGKVVGNYSLGMKQRLGIARALLHYPELLILDEPTNGLDPIGIKEMRRLILHLAQERDITIFISSHILSEMEQLADRLGIIHGGKLLEELTMDELRSMNRKYVELQVSDDNRAVLLLEEHLGITDYEVQDGGVIRVYSHLDRISEINRELVRQGIDVMKLALSEDKLEEYFAKLVGGGPIG